MRLAGGGVLLGICMLIQNLAIVPPGCVASRPFSLLFYTPNILYARNNNDLTLILLSFFVCFVTRTYNYTVEEDCGESRCYVLD